MKRLACIAVLGLTLLMVGCGEENKTGILLINEAHPENPWYYESEITYPFVTPEYVFTEGSLKRLMY